MSESIQVAFGFHSAMPIIARFTAPDSSSDGGVLLLRQADDRLGISSWFAACLPDLRDPRRVLHDRREQTRQRLFQLALGYEDCNDANALRNDPALRLACDQLPAQHGALSSQPTLCRLENAVDARSLRRLLDRFEQEYVDSFTAPPEVVVLDIDTTDDPTHGEQQLSFFHAFYDQHMYHPMLVFDGQGQLVTAILRPGNAHAAKGATPVLERLIRKLKRRFPEVLIVVRADSGFAVPRLMDKLEALDAELGGVDYLLGLAKNAVLLRLGEPLMQGAQEQARAGAKYVRHFGSFSYAAKSWAHERVVVMKAELMERGENPRFVVTSLSGFGAELLYEAYCDRGQSENWIKDFKRGLFADRLSCESFQANFFRLLEHGAAYRLVYGLRRVVSQVAPALGKAQLETVRSRLLKVGAVVKQSARQVVVELPRSFGLAAVFVAVAQALAPGG